MAVLHIELRQIPEQRETVQECTLDAVRVILVARYAERTDRWYLSIYTPAEVLLVGSLALVPGVDLLRPYRHLALPQGQLFVQSVQRLPPNFDSLEVSARLLYREAVA